MKRSMTAVIALAAAAGFAGAAVAQTQTPMTTAPATQSNAKTAPATMAPPGQQAVPSSTAIPGTAAAAPSQGTGTQASMPDTAAQDARQANTAGASAGGFWSRNISQQEVQQAQEQLKAQGLYNGPTDGLMGERTKRAIARYQQQNGLPRTATLDEATLGQLTSGPGKTGAATSGVGSSAPMTYTAPPSAGASSYTPPAGTYPTQQQEMATPQSTQPVASGQPTYR